MLWKTAFSIVLVLWMGEVSAKSNQPIQVTAVVLADSSLKPIDDELRSFLSREIRTISDVDYVDFESHSRMDRKTFLVSVFCKELKFSGGGRTLYSLSFVYSEYENQKLAWIGEKYKVPAEKLEEFTHMTGALGYDGRVTERSGIRDAVVSAIAQFDSFALEPYREKVAKPGK